MTNIDIAAVLKQADTALKNGDSEQAWALYEQVLKTEPESADANYALGTIAFQRDEFQKALQHFDQAAKTEPEAVDIACNFAMCLARVGNKIGALLQLQRASKYCGDDPEFCFRIADMSVRLGEPAAAISMLDRLSALLPRDQIVMASAEGQLGNMRDAVAILERLLEELPNDSDVAQRLSVAAANLRQYPLAISAYERFLRNTNATAIDYLRFADLLLIAQDVKRCEIAIKQAVDLGEDSGQAHVLRARVYRLNNELAKCEDAINSAIEREPLLGQAWIIRAELSDDESAKIHVNSLNESLDSCRPESVHPHQLALSYYALATLCEKCGDYAGASDALNKANHTQQSWFKRNGSDYKAELIESEFGSKKEDFTASVFDLPNAAISKSTTDPAPIFIVGLPRSGTTLVERILAQNNAVQSFGELESMEFVATEFARLQKTKALPAAEKISSEQWSELRKQYFAKIPECSSPILTDKMPHNFRHVGLILKLFPEARIIQMHRDKRDVSLSIYSHPFPAGHTYSTSFADIFDYYTQAEALMKYWSAQNSPRILE